MSKSLSWKQIYAISDFKGKIRTWTGILPLDLQISSLALYHLSYPDSVNSIGQNLSLESNGMQGILFCDAIFLLKIYIHRVIQKYFYKLEGGGGFLIPK